MEELAKLKEQIASLKTEVRRLGDITEITQLISQYGPNVDSGSAAAAARLWTDNGTFTVVGGERTFAMHGREEIAAMVSGAAHQSLIHSGAAHVLTTAHVAIDGDHAVGRNYALNIRWDAATDRFWIGRVSANRWILERTSDGWQIIERINSNLDGAEGSRALLVPCQ